MRSRGTSMGEAGNTNGKIARTGEKTQKEEWSKQELKGFWQVKKQNPWFPSLLLLSQWRFSPGAVSCAPVHKMHFQYSALLQSLTVPWNITRVFCSSYACSLWLSVMPSIICTTFIFEITICHFQNMLGVRLLLPHLKLARNAEVWLYERRELRICMNRELLLLFRIGSPILQPGVPRAPVALKWPLLNLKFIP